MKLLVSPEFSAKLSALSPSDVQQVAAFLQTVAANDKTALLEGKSHQAKLLGDGVYVLKIGQMRLYFTFGNDTEGEYVLILDATTEQAKTGSRELFATKNPKTNTALNPAFNTTINPKYNTTLNPRYNTTINPKYNTTLNPRYNTTINPKYNTTLNPRYNTTINPRYNTRLNPRYNTSINPQMNCAFGGPYLYGADLQQEAYLVRANDNVELVFDLSGNHLGQLVRVNDNVRAQFNANNEWEGYIVRANNDVSLRYDADGDWIGLVV